MRELNTMEINTVSGADAAGAMWGMLDGFGTGLSYARYATGGSFFFGAVAQLVGCFVGGIAGAVVGLGVGALTDRDTVAKLCADYRKSPY